MDQLHAAARNWPWAGGVMRVGGWGDIAIDLAGLEAGGQIPILADHESRLAGIVG